MNMSPDLQDFGDTIESLVANGLITESRLDESVRRILETKRDLGLLDSGYYDEFGHDGMDADEDVGSLADQEDALKMAQESVILLENRNGTLPIDLKKTTSVFVTGPVSDNKGFQCGGWSVFWQGSIDSTLFPNGATFKEAVQSKAAGHAQVDHLEVVDIDGKRSEFRIDGYLRGGTADAAGGPRRGCFGSSTASASPQNKRRPSCSAAVDCR
ncbi:hypothetical protein PF007_g1775 [Phytophthora fragariae]|nr:hypothetical protein PF007_g1775 [Phytophthora fragariae]